MWSCGRGITIFGAQKSSVVNNDITSNLLGIVLANADAPIRIGTKQGGMEDGTQRLAATVKPCGNVIEGNDFEISHLISKVERDHGVGIAVVGRTIDATPDPQPHRSDRITNPILHNDITTCCLDAVNACPQGCAPLVPPTPPQEIPLSPIRLCAIPDSVLDTGALPGELGDPLALLRSCMNFHGFTYTDVRSPSFDAYDTRATVPTSPQDPAPVPNPTFRHGNFWGHTVCEPTTSGTIWFGGHPGICDADITAWEVCPSEALMPIQDSGSNRAADCHPYNAEDLWLTAPTPPDLDPAAPKCDAVYHPHTGEPAFPRDVCRGEGPPGVQSQGLAETPGDLLFSLPGGSLGGLNEKTNPISVWVDNIDGPGSHVLNKLTPKAPQHTPDFVYVDDPIPSRRRALGFSVRTPQIGSAQATPAYGSGYLEMGWMQDGGLTLTDILTGNDLDPELAWDPDGRTLYVLHKAGNRIFRYDDPCLNPRDGLFAGQELAVDPAWTVVDMRWDRTRHVLYALIDIAPVDNFGGVHSWRLARIDPTSFAVALVPDDPNYFNNPLGLDQPLSLLVRANGTILVNDDREFESDRVWSVALDTPGTALANLPAVFAKGFHGLRPGVEEETAAHAFVGAPDLLVGDVLVVDALVDPERRVYVFPAAGMDPLVSEGNAAQVLEANYVFLTTARKIEKIVVVP